VRANREQRIENRERPPYGIAAIVSAAVFLLYLSTLSPSTVLWDTGEYIASAYTLSLPHPPGNPFFVLLGRVVSLMPFAPSVAIRINVLAAFCSAVSAGFWFLIADRVLAGWLESRWQRVVGAAVAALLGATAFTVWSQSVVNEKVYTVSLVGLALVAWLMVRWGDQPDGRRADRVLLLVAYLMGLGYANHMAGMLAAPAVAIAVLVRRPRTVLRWRFVLALAAIVVLGLTPFATQPIRAALHPPINTGEVTGCVDRLAVSCTFSQKTADRFLYNFNREQYGKQPLLVRQAPFSTQIGLWWLYFKWQWLRDPKGAYPFAQTMLAVFFLMLGALGGWVHWQRDRRSFWFFGPLMFTLTLALIYYLNFKPGWTQAIQMGISPQTDVTEVRDRDYFFLWSFSAWGVWAALGLVFVWQSVAEAIGQWGRLASRRNLLALPVFGLALVPLFANGYSASRRGDTFARDWAADMLNSVEPYGILITNGDNDTFPLWYAQEVEGIRKDVTVAVTSYLRTDWYARQLVRRPVYEYDAEHGPAVYRGRVWPKPTSPVLSLTLDELDAVPDYIPLPTPRRFKHGDIDTIVPAGPLLRDQILVLQFIKDSFPTRPLYFSTGSYERSLGLGDYVASQGMLTRLFPQRITESRTMQRTGNGWIDLDRSKTLWTDVFTGPRSLLARQRWIDRASEGIPLAYVITGAILADALGRNGDAAGASAVNASAHRIARATGLDGVLDR
jgi:hypothetical protein